MEWFRFWGVWFGVGINPDRPTGGTHVTPDHQRPVGRVGLTFTTQSPSFFLPTEISYDGLRSAQLDADEVRRSRDPGTSMMSLLVLKSRFWGLPGVNTPCPNAPPGVSGGHAG